MHWVIQTNIFAEEGFESLMVAIKRFDLPYTLVKVVPFVGDLEPVEGELPPEGADAVVMGSYSLARVAKRMNWTPGAWLENLDFEIQRRHWGDRMLNYDAIVCAFGSVPFQREPFFLRPVHDTKAFAGQVIDWGHYEEWRDRIEALEDPFIGELDIDTPVMVCSKKEIYSETRFWIVNQPMLSSKGLALLPGGPRVVTASKYKVGTIKRYEEVRGTRWDNDMIAFADDCAGLWSPNQAYVMDVADTPNGLKIVEVNNLNSAGWYKADLQKLINAIEELHKR